MWILDKDLKKRIGHIGRMGRIFNFGEEGLRWRNFLLLRF